MIEGREPVQTTSFIDHYCQAYQALFRDVRSFEAFKFLHVGMLSSIPRKSLPEIAKLVGIRDGQSLHHFLRDALWSVEQVRATRLSLIRQAIASRGIVVCIDETGDAKKGEATDYVAKQYIGNLGHTQNGIVSVNAYAVVDNLTYPLLFKVFKPKSRLKPGDEYKTKPQIAIELLHEIKALGFQVDLVLADCMYGETGSVIRTLEQFGWPYIVAIRSNHGVLVGPGQKVRYNRWRAYDQPLSQHPVQRRYIREIIFGFRRSTRYFEITKGSTENPQRSDSWFIMTNLEGNFLKFGNLYTLRNWIEYGFKQIKNELGWADFRLTDYPSIERWWEIVFSAYLLVSFHAQQFQAERETSESKHDPKQHLLHQHPRWEQGITWKSALNNLRLLLQPYLCWGALENWLAVFVVPGLRRGLFKLMDFIDQCFPGVAYQLQAA